MSWIHMDKTGCIIEIQVQPQSRKNEIIGLHNGRLKIKITAPPVDGKANECIVDFLSGVLSIKRSAIEILKGETAKLKVIRIMGLTEIEIERLLLKRSNT